MFDFKGGMNLYKRIARMFVVVSVLATACLIVLTGNAAADFVVNAAGDPIEGALVKLTAYPQYNGTTDALGEYTIFNVPIGTYDISASKFGYITNESTVEVTAGGTVTKDFTLILGTSASNFVYAVTPSSRISQPGSSVTFWATVLNPDVSLPIFGLNFSQASSLPVNVEFVAWDHGTGTQIGDWNTPIYIPEGGSQNFLLKITPVGIVALGSQLQLRVASSDGYVASNNLANSITIGATGSPAPDVIMAADNTDYLKAVGTTGIIAISALNIGIDLSEASVQLDTNGLPINIIKIEEVNPYTGVPIGGNTGLTFTNGVGKAFFIYYQPTSTILFQPDINRVVPKVLDGSGNVIGSQSLSIHTQ